jgi:hypothetical protein
MGPLRLLLPRPSIWRLLRLPTLAGIAPDKEQCVQSLEEQEGRLTSEGERSPRLTIVDKDREAARYGKAG